MQNADYKTTEYSPVFIIFENNLIDMGYTVEIIFGKEQVIKYSLGESLSDYENLIHRKQYEFDTKSERNNFYKGLSEGNGWAEFEIIKESQINSIKEDDEPTFDYWRFIEKYYPNYDHSDSVLLSDILSRKLSGQEISEVDETYIKDWDVRKELMKLDKELLGKAFENFFNTIYPENII